MLSTLGPLWGAIFVSALLAAIMSTADSLLSSASAHITKDFYQPLIHPKAKEKTLLRVSKISTVAVGIFALVFSFLFKDIISLLIYSYDFYTAGVFVPIIAGLVWKKANRTGAICSLVGGVSVVVLKQMGALSFVDGSWMFVLALGVSLVLMIFGSLSWPRVR